MFRRYCMSVHLHSNPSVCEDISYHIKSWEKIPNLRWTIFSKHPACSLNPTDRSTDGYRRHLASMSLSCSFQNCLSDRVMNPPPLHNATLFNHSQLVPILGVWRWGREGGRDVGGGVVGGLALLVCDNANIIIIINIIFFTMLYLLLSKKIDLCY